MITSINEYRKLLESVNDDLMKLALQFQQDHPLPDDWEGPGDCIEETAAFIMWAEKRGMKGRFIKLWGAPDSGNSDFRKRTFGDIWMHSVVLDTLSNLVIDLTHDQFDEKIPIRIYPAEEFKKKFPVGVDDDGNYINELFNSNMITDSEYINAYQKRINRERNNLLIKVAQNPNYCFILNKDMLQNTHQGELNKCETNVWKYIKTKLEQGEEHFFPVGGFLFEGDSFFPIEHWWVYDQIENKHIEVTPSAGGKISCYAGVINFEIQDKIKNSTYFHDVDFFKGGNVYDWYFN